MEVINMKRINKLFYFLLGVLVFSGISVYATTTLLSKNVTFTPQNTDWQVSDVETALNSLYEQADDWITTPYGFTLLWCCAANDSTTLTINDSVWKYVTFIDNGDGSAPYSLVFQDASANTLANITLNQKYEINSMPSKKTYLTCGSRSYRCFMVTYSK